eukprot:symbB.v1.2.034391.t1/scaffold4430.1/size39757/1
MAKFWLTSGVQVMLFCWFPWQWQLHDIQIQQASQALRQVFYGAAPVAAPLALPAPGRPNLAPRVGHDPTVAQKVLRVY